MRKLFFVCFLYLMLSFTCSISVLADSVAPPCTYKTYSKDKKYVFIMLAPDETMDCRSRRDEYRIEAKKIRNQFPVSGLYKNDESTVTLWTVDWYSYQVYLSSDAKHLVRMGPWASKENDEAFSFFNEGELIKTYKIKDLIKNISLLPHSVSHFQWEKATKLNDRTNTLEVITLENRKFNFNVRNGRKIQKKILNKKI